MSATHTEALATRSSGVLGLGFLAQTRLFRDRIFEYFPQNTTMPSEVFQEGAVNLYSNIRRQRALPLETV